jgi:uncharacterized membrane protein YfhO
MLVISESWFVGWSVWIDETPAQIESVSGYMAVRLAPGRHTIHFLYDPPAFKIGAMLTAATLLVTFALLLHKRRV